MKFKYKKYGPHILRPVIPIEILHGDRSIGYEVLVDSGADACIFDAQIGELLGIDVFAGEEKIVSGITGIPESYYQHHVQIKVGGWTYPITVGFLPGMSNISYGVVGQKGFFELFIVKFDFQKETIELKERDKGMKG